MRALACITSLSLLFALVAGCGSESSARNGAYREAAEQAVHDAVLTLEDLPSGWAPGGTGRRAIRTFSSPATALS